MNKLGVKISFCFFLGSLLLPFQIIHAQDTSQYFFDKPTKKFAIYTGGVYAVSMLGLNQLWYKDYQQSKFHLFNDNDEWLQVDKVGHFYSSYVLTSLSSEFLQGIENEKKRAFVAGGTTFLFLTTIEVFDGFSMEWGFSWGDVIANSSGIALFTAQEIIFNKQFVRIKYSYQNSEYRKIKPELLGENTLQGAFKDYNGQTYWASINLNNLHQSIKPRWLNVALGYGGEEMISATTDGVDEKGGFSPYRQYYLSLDVDFDKIPTKNKILKGVFKVANCIKVPFPTLEINRDFNTNFNWIYF